MTNVLILECDLFPDAETLDTALDTLKGEHEVNRLDLRNLPPDEESAWADAVRAIMAAEHIVTC